jgi:threonine aldolase
VVWSALSKALCAPMGSVLAADADVVAEVRDARHSLGGQQRQVGIVAAAGIVALTTMRERLPEDHARARLLAEAVAERWPACGLDPGRVQTNIVVFSHPSTDGLLDHLASNGVLAGTIAPGQVRLVTHHDVDDADLELARKAISTAP